MGGFVDARREGRRDARAGGLAGALAALDRERVGSLVLDLAGHHLHGVVEIAHADARVLELEANDRPAPHHALRSDEQPERSRLEHPLGVDGRLDEDAQQLLALGGREPALSIRHARRLLALGLRLPEPRSQRRDLAVDLAGVDDAGEPAARLAQAPPASLSCRISNAAMASGSQARSGCPGHSSTNVANRASILSSLWSATLFSRRRAS